MNKNLEKLEPLVEIISPYRSKSEMMAQWARANNVPVIELKIPDFYPTVIEGTVVDEIQLLSAVK